MDLYLSLSVSGGRPEPTYAVPPDSTVSEATVGLSAAPSAPHKQVGREQWFGKGTVVQEALSSWPVTDTLTEFPVLDNVDLSFGEVRVPGSKPLGYRLRLEFVTGKGERENRRQLECFAALSEQPGERSPVTGWLSRDFAPPGAAASLPDDLRLLLQEKELSYQRILWKATHIVQKATLDREWAVVSQELMGHGLKQISNRTWQYGKMFEYLVAENAYVTEGGQAMDMIVEFKTFRENLENLRQRER